MSKKAFASWPGLNGIARLTYTASHGITPGKAIVTSVPTAADSPAPQQFGDLIFGDGDTTITLSGCRVSNIRSSMGGEGLVWILEVEDRRWSWRDMFAIDGLYNQLDPNGKLIPWTIQSPTELAILCLENLGEENYSIDMPPGLTSAQGAAGAAAAGNANNGFLQVGQLFPPTGTNPPVSWVAEPTAQALARLCDKFGRHLVYSPISDTVSVAVPGRGNALPDGAVFRTTPSLASSDTPSSLTIVGSPTRYQMRLLLVPVGLEWDESYRPIDQLSYMPAGGWGKSVPPFINVTATDNLTILQARDLANQSVYKCYQIADMDVCQTRGPQPIQVPGYGPITQRQQLVLDDTQVEFIVPDPGDPNVRDARNPNVPLIANWYRGYARNKISAVFGRVAVPTNKAAFFNRAGAANTPADSQVYVQFTTDPVYQVITFNEPVYAFGTFNAGVGPVNGITYDAVPMGRIVAPALILQTAVTVRDFPTGELNRFELTQQLAGADPTWPPKFIVKSDVQENVIGNYDSTNTIESVESVEDDPEIRATYYLQGEIANLNPGAGLTNGYNGILAIDLDGAISQVTWDIDGDGMTTTASVNSEHQIWIAEYPARRRAENLRGQRFASGDFPGDDQRESMWSGVSRYKADIR